MSEEQKKYNAREANSPEGPQERSSDEPLASR